ncbi:MAG: hypothetical protein AAGJ80_16030, partial [Cyanobacteria bacterium J06553_1]
LHQVRPGGADKSYGIEAGRLAGLPASVIGRAKQVMSQIEQNSTIAVGLRSPQNQASRNPQRKRKGSPKPQRKEAAVEENLVTQAPVAQVPQNPEVTAQKRKLKKTALEDTLPQSVEIAQVPSDPSETLTAKETAKEMAKENLEPSTDQQPASEEQLDMFGL